MGSNSATPQQTLHQKLMQDALASVVVFLVALPLCMGIAIASGVPIDKAAPLGLMTGIVGGLIVGSLSGCRLQVTGPAAGLAVIVAQLIQQHGFQTLGVIVFWAGAIQLLAGVFRLGQVFRAVAPAVIQGMLAGIGVLIFASQFHVMVDDSPPGTGRDFGGVINLVTIPQAIWKGVVPQDGTAHHWAALIGVITIGALLLWGLFSPKKLKLVPAPLIGVLVAMGVAAALNPPIQFINLPDNMLDVVRWPLLPWPEFGQIMSGPIIIAALAMAFVASAESLLTATACDRMQQRTPRTNYDREMGAQGVGNIVCGMLGFLPLTGVIVRTAANVQAGAWTRASTVLHGVWLVIFVMLFPHVLQLIPISALAAVLVFTGVKLMNPQAVRELQKFGKGEVAIYAATLGTVVVVDLLTGIVVGIGLALAKLLYRFSHLRIEIEESPENNGRTLLRMNGSATFIRVPRLAAALEQVHPSTELHVDFEHLNYIDHACLDLLINWEKQHEATGGTLVIDWKSLHAKFHGETDEPGHTLQQKDVA
ncbi:MAG: SulP family inorganic anion transporter [Planctomycetaceae bacterium]